MGTRYRNTKRILVMALFFSGVILSRSYAYGMETSHQAQNLIEKSRSFSQIAPVKVCMVNNTVMEKPQIPVKVEGKTYYGCCQGCVGRLKEDRSVRFSKDPVTGREVDKATAFITAAPSGDAIYFESRETAEKYHASISTREKK